MRVPRFVSSRRGRVALAAGSLLALPAVSLAQDVPATFTAINFPVDPATMVSALFVAGGVIFIATASLTIGFALLWKAKRKMQGGV